MTYDLLGLTTTGTVDPRRVDRFPVSAAGYPPRWGHAPRAVIVLDEFMRDRVTLVKGDGRRFEGLRAAVRPTTISVLDVAHPIETGDHVERTLPNRTTEQYLVAHSGFRRAVHDLPAMYKLAVRKTAPAGEAPATQQGGGTSATAHPADVFTSVARTIATGVEGWSERERLADELAALRAAHGTPAFLGQYTRFIAAAGDHMPLLAPLVPALTKLLEV